jgi:signal transduction histidine kinase
MRRGWLLLARLAWLALAAAALALFTAGLPVRTKGLRQQYQPKLGLTVFRNHAGELALSPWPGYPAQRAGILEGDLLVAVNGVAAEAGSDQPLSAVLPTGAAGTPIRLSVRTGDRPVREYSVLLGGENPLALARLGLRENFVSGVSTAVEVFFALITFAIAAVIVWRKPDDPAAWLFSLAFMLSLLGTMRPVLAFYDSQPVWRPTLDMWFSLALSAFVLFFYLFPDGTFVPQWTKALVVLLGLYMMAQYFEPNLYPWRMPSSAGFLVIVGWLTPGVFAQIYRYHRHSSPIERQQTKWVVFGASAATLGAVGQLVPIIWRLPPGLPTLLNDLAGYPAALALRVLLPVTIGIAILRYRLWDVDLILNRTLVYGSLTAFVIGIYVLVVGTLGTAIQARGSLLVSILATGLVAVLFQPLRERLQRGVNHLMYGERDDPVTVLSRLGERLEATVAPDAVLPALVETVAQALKLPYAAIAWGGDGGEIAAAYGQPVGEPSHLPLVHRGEVVGELVVAPRAPGEAFNPADRHLLENIAHQAGAAVHAVRLTAELQRSRQRLVAAREEERRRLRRDLHDGLGPNLASQNLKLAAVKQLLARDTAAAAPLLDQVMTQNQGTVDEIRRLVYDLRPPALDTLGLVAAIRDYVAGLDGKASLQVQVAEPAGGLPPLTAAVEVAAYRIALEALANVIRHARADHCVIRFALAQNGAEAALEVEIEDDGRGLPEAPRAGVGLRSMRERAEEVGGTLGVEAARPHGTRVRARLPLLAEREPQTAS